MRACIRGMVQLTGHTGVSSAVMAWCSWPSMAARASSGIQFAVLFTLHCWLTDGCCGIACWQGVPALQAAVYVDKHTSMLCEGAWATKKATLHQTAAANHAVFSSLLNSEQGCKG